MVLSICSKGGKKNIEKRGGAPAVIEKTSMIEDMKPVKIPATNTRNIVFSL